MKQKLTTLRRSEVPEYLHSSELYLSFNDETGDDEISVPSDCVKADLTVRSLKDVKHLLRTMRFWILPLFPNRFVDILIGDRTIKIYRSKVAKITAILQEFESAFPGTNALVKELHEKFQRKRDDVCEVAARYGRIDFIEYLVGLKKPVTVRTLKVAAVYGHYCCMQYLYDLLAATHGQSLSLSQVDVCEVVRNGHLACVKFLLQHGATASSHAWTIAVEASSTACFELLLDANPLYLSSNKDQLQTAALLVRATAPVLQCLLRRGHSIPAVTAIYAAQIGNLQCLQLLHAHCGLDCYVPSVMAAAAAGGHLHLIHQLHALGCAWDDLAPIAALRHNKASCLAFFLQQRGIPQTAAFRAVRSSDACRLVVSERRVKELEQLLEDAQREIEQLKLDNSCLQAISAE